MKAVYFTAFEADHFEAVLAFSDLWIGKNYYSRSDLEEIFEKAQHQGLNASLLAWDEDRLIGVRLTLAPSQWVRPEMQLTPQRWQVDPEKVGYFKSLFVDSAYRAQGVGQRLSAESVKILQQQGAEAIVTHSWLESPGNSSQRYLQKAGFVEVARHPKFWELINYECIRCSPKRCECTAVEMIQWLKE